MKGVGTMGSSIPQRLFALGARIAEPNDGFPLVNFTVGLLAINCFLLAAINVVPLPARSTLYVASWLEQWATLLIFSMAGVAFLYDCTWKARYFALSRAATRFVALTSVLTVVLLVQIALARFAV